jgi:hypothetical protein
MLRRTRMLSLMLLLSWLYVVKSEMFTNVDVSVVKCCVEHEYADLSNTRFVAYGHYYLIAGGERSHSLVTNNVEC